jgi:hypothetical protein
MVKLVIAEHEGSQQTYGCMVHLCKDRLNISTPGNEGGNSVKLRTC